MVGEIQIMTVEEDQVSTDVEQAHNGDIVDMRLIRRPENVTEANLADIFAFQLKGKAVFCFDDKHWYLWNGERWQRDKQKQMLLRTAEFVREIAKLAVDAGEPNIARRVLGFLSAQKLENLEKLAKPRLGIHLTDFDADPMQLCVENGVIDLATGKLLEPGPSMHHRHAINSPNRFTGSLRQHKCCGATAASWVLLTGILFIKMYITGLI